MVLAAEWRLPYSHVGIAVVQDDGVWVVHATTDEPPGSDGIVKLETLDEFLAGDRASAAAVYRTEDSGSARTAAVVASDYARRHLPFDASFDLSTTNRLYCTELVWRAYLAAGVDLTGGAADDLAIPLGHGPYLLPGTILKGDHLRRIAEFTVPRTLP
jgi:hypothetical protein